MRSGLVRCVALLLLLLPSAAASSVAQCADGTPPPCGGLAVRRPAPALDQRTWIVLPFDNVTRARDIDWLKDASVNLLYLDMSKWLDVRVIDDERVADLIREVPEARGAQLSLQSGIAVARRAGAGKLVMGDLLKVGSRTQLVGKVFDVRTGQRVRTVRQEAGSADSIMVAFGQLARGVLDVASPQGATQGGIGTQSIGAYRAYMLGVGYLNRWILDSAHAEFDRALGLDSTFALAHYKLALVYGWESSGSALGIGHANTALRLGSGLPQRERSLVKGYAAFENNRYAEACDVFQGLLRADSADVEAWYQLGECSYHDNAVIPLPGDSTQFVFRSSWNTALRAFRKTLELDPTYHLAFQHIQDALLASVRTGCRIQPAADPCSTESSIFQGFLRRAADSLVTVPVNVLTGIRELSSQTEAAAREHARTRNLEEARQAAESWLAAGPGETRPLIAYGRILLRLGRVPGADSILRRIPAAARMTRIEGATLLTDRIEIAIKLGKPSEALRIADSLYRVTDSVAGARMIGVLVRGVFGQTGRLGPAIEAQLQGNTPAWVKSYYVNQARAIVGAPAESVYAAEAAFASNVARAQGNGRAATLISTSLFLLDPRERGSRWPITDTASSDQRVAALSFLALGDTTRFKERLGRLDALFASNLDGADAGQSLAFAQLWLTVRDSATALRSLQRFRETSWSKTPILDPVGPGFVRSGMVWPRTLLLQADLEAAIGERAAAINGYRLFLELWQAADPENQATVERAKAALRRLGG